MALTATNAYGNNTNTKNNYITVGQCSGRQLLRHADLGQRPVERDLHRLLHQLAYFVVVDVR